VSFYSSPEVTLHLPLRYNYLVQTRLQRTARPYAKSLWNGVIRHKDTRSLIYFPLWRSYVFRLKSKLSSGQLYKNVKRSSCTEANETLQEMFSTYPSRKILIEYCCYTRPTARLINGYTAQNTLSTKYHHGMLQEFISRSEKLAHKIHTHGVSPLLHVSALDRHLHGGTPVIQT